jgi:hypothetical protein
MLAEAGVSDLYQVLVELRLVLALFIAANQYTALLQRIERKSKTPRRPSEI